MSVLLELTDPVSGGLAVAVDNALREDEDDRVAQAACIADSKRARVKSCKQATTCVHMYMCVYIYI